MGYQRRVPWEELLRQWQQLRALPGAEWRLLERSGRVLVQESFPLGVHSHLQWRPELPCRGVLALAGEVLLSHRSQHRCLCVVTWSRPLRHLCLLDTVSVAWLRQSSSNCRDGLHRCNSAHDSRMWRRRRCLRALFFQRLRRCLFEIRMLLMSKLQIVVSFLALACQKCVLAGSSGSFGSRCQ